MTQAWAAQTKGAEEAAHDDFMSTLESVSASTVGASRLCREVGIHLCAYDCLLAGLGKCLCLIELKSEGLGSERRACPPRDIPTGAFVVINDHLNTNLHGLTP